MRTPTDLKRGLKTFGSREALAAKLGVTNSTVWRWEHGQAMPGVALKLLRLLLEQAQAVPRG